MNADDPRHGTRAGYGAGCRLECCRLAMNRYEKRRKLDQLQGIDRSVPSLGTARRLQALTALGWSTLTLAHRLDCYPRQVRDWTRQRHPIIYASTAARIEALFDELCLTLPPETTAGEKNAASRARGRARRLGYAPALAWDDIDHDERATGRRTTYSSDYDSRDLIDEATILRILDGERLPANQLERLEVTRRWQLAGRSVRVLCRFQGWKEGRYSRVTSEGAA